MRQAVKNKLQYYFIFIIWPSLSLLLASLNYNKKWAKNIFWFFSIFTAYTLILPNINENHDLVRYMLNFEWYVNNKDTSFSELIQIPFSHGLNSDLDYYLVFMNVIISRFTDNFRIFLSIIGLVFGYFMSRNLFFVSDNFVLRKKNYLTIIIFITLFLLFPFWIINGYRYATASVVYIFGVLNYLKSKQKIFLLFILFSPLIHFTYLFPIAIFILYIIIGNKIKLYFIVALISIFYSGIAPDLIYKSNELAPLILRNKIKGYSETGYVVEINNDLEQANWYVKGHLISLKFFVIALLSLILLKWKRIKINSLSLSLISLGAIQFSVTQVLTTIPGMERFLWSAYFLILSGILVIISINYNKRLINKYNLILISFPFLIYSIVRVRIGLEEIGLSTILLNPLIAPFFKFSESIFDYIK